MTIKDGGVTTLDIISNGTTNVTFDAPGDIVMDADGADIVLKDAGTTFGSVTQAGGELVLKSGSSPTTAATFSGANLTLAGDMTIGGNDIKASDGTTAITTSGANVSLAGNLSVSGGINTTSGSNVAHDEASSTTLTANNNRRGKYTFTTNATVADNDHSAKFTVANNTATSDDIVVMNCTSNHQIEVHTFNISSSGWDFIIVNRSGGVLAADTDLVFNFIVLQ